MVQGLHIFICSELFRSIRSVKVAFAVGLLDSDGPCPGQFRGVRQKELEPSSFQANLRQRSINRHGVIGVCKLQFVQFFIRAAVSQ